MLNRTSFCILGRWYLPVFLFRDGLLTLMYMASFISLMRLWFSLLILNLMRLMKEAIYIRVNNPSLNRNMGKYHLPHIWDEVLFNITELKLKIEQTNWPCGYSICHIGNKICHNRTFHPMWLFNLPQWQSTSAIPQCGYSASHIGNNSCQVSRAEHPQVVFHLPHMNKLVAQQNG